MGEPSLIYDQNGNVTTSLSSTELLKLRYRYNLASDRLSLQTEKGSSPTTWTEAGDRYRKPSTAG